MRNITLSAADQLIDQTRAQGVTLNDEFRKRLASYVQAADGQSAVKRFRSVKLIEACLGSGRGSISYQVVKEFANLARKKFATRMSSDDCEAFIEAAIQPPESGRQQHGPYSHGARFAGRAALQLLRLRDGGSRPAKWR